MARNIGRNMQHLLDFMARINAQGGSGAFSFAYRDRATVNAVKALERRGMVKVDWVTKQIILA